MALSGQINTNDVQTRYYYLSWSATQSIADNTSTISWSVGCAGGTSGWYMERDLVVTLAGQTLVNKKNEIKRYAGEIASGKFTVTHDAAGKLDINGEMHVSCYLFTINLHGNEKWSLDDIPRKANLTDASNFTDEENPTITYSNPAGNNVTSLQACLYFDDLGIYVANYRDISKTGSNYTFHLTEAERNILRNNCTTSNSRQVTFYITTVIGGNTFHSALKKTITIVNSNPIITKATAYNTTLEFDALTGSNKKIIKGFNNIKAEILATGVKSATIKQVTIRNGSRASHENTVLLNGVEDNVFVFTAEDSRGNTTTENVTLEMIDYVKLTSNLDIFAPNTAGDLDFSVNGNYFNNSFGIVANTLSVQYRYKENNGVYGNWINIPYLVTENTYNGSVNIKGLNYRSFYTFQVRAIDKINVNGIITPEKIIRTTPVFDWGENDFNFNVPVSFNGKPLIDLIYPVGSIYMSVNSANPETILGGVWERWGEGRVAVSVDESQTEFNKAEKLGGEKEHTLTVGEMPSHSHGFQQYNLSGTSQLWAAESSVQIPTKANYNLIDNAGGDKAHNNMQPYITCYMWKRTA